MNLKPQRSPGSRMGDLGPTGGEPPWGRRRPGFVGLLMLSARPSGTAERRRAGGSQSAATFVADWPGTRRPCSAVNRTPLAGLAAARASLNPGCSFSNRYETPSPPPGSPSSQTRTSAWSRRGFDSNRTRSSVLLSGRPILLDHDYYSESSAGTRNGRRIRQAGDGRRGVSRGQHLPPV